MTSWKKEITSIDPDEQLKREYRNLLSVGKSGEQAESLLIDCFYDRFSESDSVKGRFWLALALYEWEFGRLTQRADCNARLWITYPWDNISKTALDNLLKTLDSPMPPKKKVRLPQYVSHCPWPEGSILAYRIVSSSHPHVTHSPFYGKYVLLRIIQIIRHPITRLAPNDAWTESMLVGLYNWIGDSIPDPKIVDQLQFTPISVQKPMLSTSVYQRISSIQGTAGTTQLQQLLARTIQLRIETCCDLDWKCIKGIDPADVFTYLGCNPTFVQQESFFQTSIGDYAMCHSIPFDAVLVNRFNQLAD